LESRSNLRVPNNIREILEDFKNKVIKVLGKDTQIYLFGSYARGDWLNDSDLDLIVISNKFKNMSLEKRYRIVRSLLPTNISVELLLYTPEEFEKIKKKSIIIKDAMEYWIEIL